MTDKEFKLFDKQLNLDLTILFQYLETKHEQILGNTLPENNTLTDLVVKKYNNSIVVFFITSKFYLS